MDVERNAGVYIEQGDFDDDEELHSPYSFWPYGTYIHWNLDPDEVAQYSIPEPTLHGTVEMAFHFFNNERLHSSNEDLMVDAILNLREHTAQPAGDYLPPSGGMMKCQPGDLGFIFWWTLPLHVSLRGR